MVECLLSIYKTPGSNPSTTKKEKGSKGGDEGEGTMKKTRKYLNLFMKGSYKLHVIVVKRRLLV